MQHKGVRTSSAIGLFTKIKDMKVTKEAVRPKTFNRKRRAKRPLATALAWSTYRISKHHHTVYRISSLTLTMALEAAVARIRLLQASTLVQQLLLGTYTRRKKR